MSNFIALKVALSFKKLLSFFTYPKYFLVVPLLDIGCKDGGGTVGFMKSRTFIFPSEALSFDCLLIGSKVGARNYCLP